MVVRAWVSFVTHRCADVQAWENVIAGKGEAVLDMNEVRRDWRRIISGTKKNNCFGIKK